MEKYWRERQRDDGLSRQQRLLARLKSLSEDFQQGAIDADAFLARASIELGDPYVTSIYLLADLLITGEVDSAIAFFEANARKIGFERDEVRPFVTLALDENTGLEYLGNWIDTRIAGARNYEEQYSPYYWYLYFGYLDEYWQIIEARAEPSAATWDGTGDLEHTGRYHSASGFAAHPAYIPHVEHLKMTALWDSRGKPDTCSKASDRWVCE